MEQREFKLHKDILWSIIQSQAGSLQKALLELVMNSVDAGAACVDITLTETALKVVDDGKGFTDRSEIEAFFETFGTPHQEGDAVFGKFRMGRGMLMSFTRNTWRSGPFAMEVDIRDQGLNYVLKTDAEPVSGCTITGELYEPLKPSELLTTIRALEELCKYTPIPVILNGKRISVDLANEKWTFVDDDAYYLIRNEAAALTVYNLGVEVCRYNAYQYGTGGVVVSRKQLQVNFARNDILLSKCEVWKRIAAVVRAYSRASQQKKPVKNENYRALTALQLASADMSLVEFLEALRVEKLITDMTGKHYSFEELRSAVVDRYANVLSVAPSLTDIKADKLHTSRVAFIVSPKTLERFRMDSVEELFDKVESAYRSLQGELARYDYVLRLLETLRTATRPYQSVSQRITDRHFPVDETTLSAEEKEALVAIEAGHESLVWAFNRLDQRRVRRALRVGESETAQAWTDGQSVIFINRNLLKIQGFKGSALTQFAAMGSLLVHEYVHSDDDSSGHLHDAEFYETYEALTCGTSVIGEFLNAALNRWLALRKKAGTKRQRAGELHEMDRQAELQAAMH